MPRYVESHVQFYIIVQVGSSTVIPMYHISNSILLTYLNGNITYTYCDDGRLVFTTDFIIGHGIIIIYCTIIAQFLLITRICQNSFEKYLSIIIYKKKPPIKYDITATAAECLQLVQIRYTTTHIPLYPHRSTSLSSCRHILLCCRRVDGIIVYYYCLSPTTRLS